MCGNLILLVDLSFSHSIFVVLSNSTLMPNLLPSMTMPPPSHLCHHMPSPLLHSLLHHLTPPAPTNQPHHAQMMTDVIWALGTFFQVLFISFQPTNSFICFFLGFLYVIYYNMAHPHLHHCYKHLLMWWKQATGMVKMGRAQQQKRRGATTTKTMGQGDTDTDNEGTRG